MFRTCVTCGANTILAHSTDGHGMVMEADPSTDGATVLKGDPADEPTAIFGIETEKDAEWFGVPFESDRYDRHECKETR